MKMVKLLLIFAVIGGVIAVAAKYSGPSDTPAPMVEQQDEGTKPKKEKPRLEEKYGITGESALP